MRARRSGRDSPTAARRAGGPGRRGGGGGAGSRRPGLAVAKHRHPGVGCAPPRRPWAKSGPSSGLPKAGSAATSALPGRRPLQPRQGGGVDGPGVQHRVNGSNWGQALSLLRDSHPRAKQVSGPELTAEYGRQDSLQPAGVNRVEGGRLVGVHVETPRSGRRPGRTPGPPPRSASGCRRRCAPERRAHPGTSWVWPVAAAAPQTPRPKAMRRQPSVPW
jgi:hypothetical protein